MFRSIDLGDGIRILYDDERILGSGSGSTTYEGFFEEDTPFPKRVGGTLKAGEPVAIKIVDEPERLSCEVRSVLAFDHPNVLCVYAVSSRPVPLVVMEKIPDESLANRVACGDLMSEAMLLNVARDVLMGLEHIHERGLVHLDIKPENLVHTGYETVIIDFGMLRSELNATATRDFGGFCGTIAYCASEWHPRSDDPIDGRSDLYSVGISLYELGTGALPFRGGFIDVLDEKRHTALSSDALSPEWSPRFRSLLRFLTHPNQAARFSTATEALDEVSACIDKRDTPFWVREKERLTLQSQQDLCQEASREKGDARLLESVLLELTEARKSITRILHALSVDALINLSERLPRDMAHRILRMALGRAEELSLNAARAYVGLIQLKSTPLPWHGLEAKGREALDAVVREYGPVKRPLPRKRQTGSWRLNDPVYRYAEIHTRSDRPHTRS